MSVKLRMTLWITLMVLLLAATGVVALVIFGVQAIQKSQDDTALREDGVSDLIADDRKRVTERVIFSAADVYDDARRSCKDPAAVCKDHNMGHSMDHMVCRCRPHLYRRILRRSSPMCQTA